ncbi:UDP-glycosyltransferase UGT5 isoform X1 [Nilaparvata lugens]|uniref:UDP-glycosyltransferase UGT5 isoform X1 n=1 Tax=Nilaparvata lugens TaxID=108931 RepID=UPI00193CE519|nr:UDP-glycosyltransferase UGT5 isoform X1 [Nilaparvata lugens]XP_022190399.2 UDP-glycosyltransferase UGT5 isoform X1 [Nilaparvata lugens]XP_039282644.1 UDP-glycosyltransferase UGT5 isoform X1 [Nilaparvata lugens]
MDNTVSVILLCLVSFLARTDCAKILAVFPHIAKSHQDVFQPLVEELAARGHQVTVVSFFPRKEPLANFTDIPIDAHDLPPVMHNSLPINLLDSINPIKDFFIITDIGMQCCESVLASSNVQKLLKSDEQFDLIITELFTVDCFLGFAHRFKSPNIAVSSSVLLPSNSDRFANSDNPAIVPNLFLSLSDKMTYKERFFNTFATLFMKTVRRYYYDVAAERIARKYFGSAMPPLDEIAKNTSLVLVNTHPSLNRPRPQVPAVIDVGGMHIKDAKKLPSDLESFMNSSTNGVIVFSMGSVLLTHTFPDDKRKMIMEVFSELPQNVVCKWESDSLPNKPDNVKILKWLPQRDILAHPNVVAFVTHGGLLGLSEAAFEAVPIIGIPMYGDQGTNVRAFEASGAGLFLSYSTINKQSFKQALQAVVNDKRYKENAQRMSNAYRERILPPLDTAVYWTEYVLKFGGAKHLQVASVHMPWYQYLLLDVLLGAAVVIFLILYIVYRVARRITTFILPYLTIITVHKKGD